MRERLISSQPVQADEDTHNLALRPERLCDYVGQPDLSAKLEIALTATRQRQEPLEHVLLHGPPGLGKTTLAHIIAKELGTHLAVTSGPALTKAGDLVGILTKLQARDVLFIDEIHRLPIALEEFLYSAMEDFKVDVKIDDGLNARTLTLPVKPFTLIGATTRAGMLSGPMRTRFGIAHNLQFYTEDDLAHILSRSADLLGLATDTKAKTALATIAKRSRGTPRIANRLLRRARDFAQVKLDGKLTPAGVDDALALEGVDALGLDELDRKFIRCIAETYQGGPVGLEAIAASLGEDSGTLEQAVEPFLLQAGFLARTRQGRQLTGAAWDHLGIQPDKKTELF